MENLMKTIIFCLFCVIGLTASASVTGSFKVNGDADKFYPVTFADGAWDYNVATELAIGRSNVHADFNGWGTVISKFSFHVSRGGHLANFIDADVKQGYASFIGGWKDVTSFNGNEFRIIIWLRGGGTTYNYNSNYAVNPTIYDGVANPIVYNEASIYTPGGTNHTFKTAIDSYVNSQGVSYQNNAYFSGLSTNYFGGNIGVGTTDTRGYKLAVAGSAVAESVTVKLQGNWPDYVFKSDYELPSLAETEKSIKENGHLPGIPPASEVKSSGIDLGEMNAKLLKKIEELTLYIIDLKKESDLHHQEILKLKSKYN